MTTILCSQEELNANIKKGIKPEQITDLPDKIKQWTVENRTRFKPDENGQTGIEWLDNSPALTAIANQK